MKFYEVKAKCGHVGKGHYYEGIFYVKAASGSEAAAVVRYMPRVKHHHKDAILNVFEVGYAQYSAGRAAMLLDPYYSCHSRQEQNCYIDELSECVYVETQTDKPRKDDTDRRAKLKAIREWERKQNKYPIGSYDDAA
jgi:hypothetical protein